MTRILYWNIENFSEPTIQETGTSQETKAAAMRLNHILNEVLCVHVPDIFVVVEVYDRTKEINTEGIVISKKGGRPAAGVLALLAAIRNSKAGKKWCVVPPLTLGAFGKSEAVAVFYNADKLKFAGPFIYSSLDLEKYGRAVPANEVSYALLLDYPAKWSNALPSPKNTIEGLNMDRQYEMDVPGLGSKPVPEWQLAGQWTYYYGPPPPKIPLADPKGEERKNDKRIYFNGKGFRSPFLTQFQEVGGAGRLIKLFSIHTSPSTARKAVPQFALAEEIKNVKSNEVSVVLGDFNVDTFSAEDLKAYEGLEQLGYTMQLNPRDSTKAINPARKPYCMTHLLPIDTATPYNNTGEATDPTHNVYPRYGYMGSGEASLEDWGAIDNVFTKYGTGTAGSPQNITVVNTVVGTPYDGIMPPPEGVTPELTGGLEYESAMANKIPKPTPSTPGGVNPDADMNNFRGPENFGKIRTTSDHLALIIDV